MKGKLSDVYDEYLTFMRSMGLADNTIRNVQGGIGGLVREYGDMRVNNITTAHISAYFLEMSKVRSPSSLENLHSLLVRFFRYCVETGYVKPHANPMSGRRRPKVTKRERLRIPVHRFPELLELAGARFQPRDRILVALGLYTLLRDQEMARLRVRDIDLGAGHIKADISKSHLEDYLPISGDLDVELRRWYKAYQKGVGQLKPDYLLLPSHLTGATEGCRHWPAARRPPHRLRPAQAADQDL